MAWLLITITAYFFNAVANVTDKFLLKKQITEPAVFAFFVSLLGAVALVLAPLDLRIPTLPIFLISILSGISFTGALYFFYKALKNDDASRVVPAVGGLTPVFILILAYILLGEVLLPIELLAFVLIILGGYLILKGSKKSEKNFQSEVIHIFTSALLFALSHVLAKYIYVHHSFEGGMALKGLGLLSGALFLFCFPTNRKKIRENFKGDRTEERKKGSKLFFFGQAAAALGFFLQNYAFSIGSVALTAALSGIQYVFLFMMISFLSLFHKDIVKEKLSKEIVIRKIWSISLIIIGMIFLFWVSQNK